MKGLYHLPSRNPRVLRRRAGKQKPGDRSQKSEESIKARRWDLGEEETRRTRLGGWHRSKSNVFLHPPTALTSNPASCRPSPGSAADSTYPKGVNEILSKSLCLFHGYSSTLDKIEAHMNSSRREEVGPIISLFEATAVDISAATDAHPEIDIAAHICLCRDNCRTVRLKLKPRSIMILGGRKRWCLWMRNWQEC